ncbi:hypothetical protein D3C76_1722920 [compost metagenome]
MVGQIQALLVHAVGDAVLLILQTALAVAQPEARGRPLPLLAQCLHLLIKCAGVGLHRLSLLAQSSFLVRGQYG